MLGRHLTGGAAAAGPAPRRADAVVPPGRRRRPRRAENTFDNTAGFLHAPRRQRRR
jgi:hypothetical protein